MRAVKIKDGQFELGEAPDPAADGDQVVVRIRAAGLNAADLQQARGAYPAPPGWPDDIPGLEIAGVVEDPGPTATGWAAGDRVMAVVGGGAHAERIAVPASLLLPIPDSVDDVHAAGFPEAFSTAWDGLVDPAGVRPGERVLVTGAAGGVGTAMVQVAALAGADVVASVRRPETHAAVQALAPEATVVTPEQEEENGPYDIVVELVGGKDCLRRVRWLNPYGRILVIGVGAGEETTLRLFDLMRVRGRVLGSTIRARSTVEKAALANRVRKGLLAALATGRLTVPVDSVYPLEQAAEAYVRLGTPGKLGKIVLRTE
ncbi:zinc-binding alcohol dehydrogenase [Amycolatopsis sp. AA4]|uniref:alcohol dehydrogenase catalytic domain-containing protein n=1 Tax=Actinomycetes TaxID=1760 RepID=UPI0001B54B48|nr:MULTISPECIES: zinc-binding dehydrogenase [Actinomycetes]ATY13043.1 zinc-binding alcohol dehydrogenase [Amycolatopsis sp. AA4]EFL08918.1 zinc-binding alcohol dehydrogenase [Streptomyces sp. AA4]